MNIAVRVVLMLVTLFFFDSVRAQAFPKESYKKDVPFEKLAFVEVKKGQGCYQVSRQIKRSVPVLGIEICRQLVEELGRLSRVDNRILMMPIELPPILHEGDLFFYIFSKDGNDWVYVPVGSQFN